MKRFIVTGGYGFIGSNLVKLLLEKKFKVLNIDKLSYSAQKYNLKNIRSKNYFFKKVDINNKKEVIKILKKYRPHGIFNLAADTHVDRSIDDSFNFIKNNILGVYNLLEAIKDYKKKPKFFFKKLAQMSMSVRFCHATSFPRPGQYCLILVPILLSTDSNTNKCDDVTT